MDTAQRHGTDLDSLYHITSCRNLLFDPLGYMENSVSTEIDDFD